MSGGVIPTVRVRDLEAALAFYLDELGFVLVRGDPSEGNCAVTRGDARVMLESAAGHYSEGYNEAIRGRLGTPSAVALYIEAPDLEALVERTESRGVETVDPLADRPWGQREYTIADPDGTWLTFWRVADPG